MREKAEKKVLKKTKQRKQKEKKKKGYVPQKALFGDLDDYGVYRPEPYELLLGGLVIFGIGFFVGMVFYRNILLSAIVGAAALYPGMKKYKDMKKDRRQHALLLQFRDMMESLTASYSVGKNTNEAFQDALADLSNIYAPNADIVNELRWIVNGILNGKDIQELLDNFARRSHLDDIESFATIFAVSSQYGGNLKRVVAETRDIISDKIEIELEIQTLLTANKNELNIMIVMPVILMLMLSSVGNLSIVQNTPLNVLVKTVAIVIFVAAYMIGQKIVNIRI